MRSWLDEEKGEKGRGERKPSAERAGDAVFPKMGGARAAGARVSCDEIRLWVVFARPRMRGHGVAKTRRYRARRGSCQISTTLGRSAFRLKGERSKEGEGGETKTQWDEWAHANERKRTSLVVQLPQHLADDLSHALQCLEVILRLIEGLLRLLHLVAQPTHLRIQLL